MFYGRSEWVSIITSIIMFIFLLIITGSCTLSFQNISTHGTASDVVDEDQKASPDISPNFEIPGIYPKL